MKRRITVRPLLEELLKDDDLIISYIESPDGFDLSVRYDYDRLNCGTPTPKKNIDIVLTGGK